MSTIPHVAFTTAILGLLLFIRGGGVSTKSSRTRPLEFEIKKTKRAVDKEQVTSRGMLAVPGKIRNELAKFRDALFFMERPPYDADSGMALLVAGTFGFLLFVAGTIVLLLQAFWE
jgi:hypothetical protein